MKKNIVNIILLVLWMIVIFYLSSKKGNDSQGQSNIITNIIVKIFNIDNSERISLIVRKAAHVTEYFILGLLSYNCFKNYFDSKTIIVSMLFCVLYSATDEFHQLFVEGRTGQIKDVLIDSIGIILSNIIMFIKGV